LSLISIAVCVKSFQVVFNLKTRYYLSEEV
jgi:hypothetical protein